MRTFSCRVTPPRHRCSSLPDGHPAKPEQCAYHRGWVLRLSTRRVSVAHGRRFCRIREPRVRRLKMPGEVEDALLRRQRFLDQNAVRLMGPPEWYECLGFEVKLIAPRFLELGLQRPAVHVRHHQHQRMRQELLSSVVD